MTEPTSQNHPPRWPEAVRAWRERLGAAAVQDDPATLERYGHNVTEYRPRLLRAALYPTTVDQVRAVVDVARAHGVSLYPVSTGRNWGVGSKLPVVDGAAIVDLSRMARVRSVDARTRTAVVEPGVTQAALAAYLQQLGRPLRLNVTGSGGETSVIGNALERGVGVLGQRSEDVRGVEAVLGTGEVVRTGLWHFAGDGDAVTHHYAPGLGPDLTGLFAQSGVGIVTAMAVRLFPAQEVSLVLAGCSHAGLSACIDGLAGLRADGVVRDRIEVDRADDPRVAALTGAPTGDAPPWVVWMALHGSARMRDAACDEARGRLASVCTVFRRFDSVADAVAQGIDRETVQVRFDLVAGIPSDFSIRAMARAHGVDAVAAQSGLDLDVVPEIPGFVCVLPAVPLVGACVADVAQLIEATAREHGVAVYQSYNTISDAAMEGYLRASFDRRDADAVARCHRWCADAHARLHEHGVFLLRANVEQMHASMGRDDSFWRAVERLNRAFDPAGVIAPGRYAPLK